MGRIALGLLSVTALSCNTVHPTERLEDWWLFDQSGFSMRVPPEVQGGPVQGIDSSVGKFESSYLSLAYDYGMYGVGFELEPRLENWTVDDQAAQVELHRFPPLTKRFDHFAAIHFAKAGEEGAKLTVWAWFNSEDQLKTVKQIFRSITFSARRRPDQ